MAAPRGFKRDCADEVSCEQLTEWISQLADHLNKSSLKKKAPSVAQCMVEEHDLDTEAELAVLTTDDLKEIGLSVGVAKALGNFLGGAPDGANILWAEPQSPTTDGETEPQSPSPGNGAASPKSVAAKQASDGLLAASQNMAKARQRRLGGKEEAPPADVAAPAAQEPEPAAQAEEESKKPRKAPKSGALLDAAVGKNNTSTSPGEMKEKAKKDGEKKKSKKKPMYQDEAPDIKEKDLRRVEKVFDKTDYDDTGEIDLSELSAVHKGNALRLLAMMDMDGTGEISKKDWVQWFQRLLSTAGPGQFKFQLKYFERNAEKLGQTMMVISDSDEEHNYKKFKHKVGKAMRKRSDHAEHEAKFNARPLEEHVKFIFDRLDRGDGHFCKEMMKKKCGKDGVELMECQHMDPDMDGVVSWADWHDYWINMLGPPQPHELRSHALEILESHLLPQEEEERRERREYFKMAQSRRKIGMSPKYSTRPHREKEEDWEWLSKTDFDKPADTSSPWKEFNGGFDPEDLEELSQYYETHGLAESHDKREEQKLIQQYEAMMQRKYEAEKKAEGKEYTTKRLDPSLLGAKQEFGQHDDTIGEPDRPPTPEYV